MTDVTTDFNSRSLNIRDRFLGKIPCKIDQMVELIESLSLQSAGSKNFGRLHELVRIAHAIAGTAGTFNFTKLATSASRLEISAEIMISDRREIDTDAVECLLDNIKLILDDIKKIELELVDFGEHWKINATPSVNSRVSIVLVDEDEEYTSVLAHQLSAVGFNIRTLSSLDGLKNLLRSFEPSVLVIDMVFGSDSCIATDTIIKLRDDGILTCRVIFLSIIDNFTARLSALRSGCYGYLSKSIALPELIGDLVSMADVGASDPYRVVVLNDDRLTSEFYCEALSYANINSISITDPFKLLSLINSIIPDLILIDINMPGCNGFELTKIIRQHESMFYIPIIFISSTDLESDSLQSISSGGDELIRNGTSNNELINRVLARCVRSRQLSSMISRMKISESRFRSVSEMAASAIISCDNRNKIITWNAAATKLFGYSELEVVGSNIVGMLAIDDQDKFESDFNKKHITAIDSRGRVFPVEVSRSFWMGDDIRYCTNIFRDISLQKEYEASLVMAKVQAEDANRAKSDFLSSMSHELRTPLNSILGFAQLMDYSPSDKLSDSQKKFTKHIIGSGNHLLQLINNVLDLAKIESGKIDLSVEAVVLEELILESLSMVESMAEKSAIKIHKVEPWIDTEQLVYADKTRLKQVLVNLLSNAIKYNNSGGEVYISCCLEDGMLNISVRDTGIGIPKDKQDKVFEAFNRLGVACSGIEGSGIGLALSKTLMQVMGGSIDFDREIESGASFWINIPIVEYSRTTGNTHPLGQKDLTGLHSLQKPGADHLLLYIEDNHSNLMLMKSIMMSIPSVRLMTAVSAEEGIEIAYKEQPDVIIMDINLPGISGVEALDRLKSEPVTQAIPVIALTANAMVTDVLPSDGYHFEFYLTKPIVIDKILSCINSCVAST